MKPTWTAVLFCAFFLLQGCGPAKHDEAGDSRKSDKPESRLLRVVVGNKVGYIDGASGKIAINPQFDLAYGFTEGRAMVCVGECDSDHIMGHRFTDNYQIVPLDQTFKYGFIDETGKFVVNPQYENVNQFSEGFAAVCVGQGCYWGTQYKDKEHKWGYIDREGKIAITPQFDKASGFKGGLAAVSIGGKWGYIDESGKYVINPQFSIAMPFEKGVAEVTVGEGQEAKTGWIDKTGRYVWQPSR
jgi:hypothetical protein